jgi:predicted metal-dependent phosphoesterase TrpH
MQKADLHVHTNASDGLLSPKEVVQWAARKRIKAVAITDHDTVKGIDEAILESKGTEVEVVPGIEFSAEFNDEEIHILGYYLDYKAERLTKLLQEIHNSRHNRATEIIDKLNSIGVHITLEQVEAIADNGIIGRPHIARALIESGYIQNIKEAFDKYIGKGKAAYVDRYKITCKEAIDLIKDLGGVSVLAHPGLLRDTSIISSIFGMGLNGIEVYHTKHTAETITKMLCIAHARKLIITGGSDCHGMLTNNEPILGNVWVDYTNVLQLKNLSQIK